MSRLIASFQVLALVVGLFALTVPAGLACCAGAVDAHGPACCDSAAFDALARSCCQGDGEELTLSPQRPQASPPLAATALPTTAASAPTRLLRVARATAALAPCRGLFTLNSALLL